MELEMMRNSQQWGVDHAGRTSPHLEQRGANSNQTLGREPNQR